MHKSIQVIIVEEDSFAKNWMALLLARDWRTQIIYETDSAKSAFHFVEGFAGRPDFILLDADQSLTTISKIEQQQNSGIKTPGIILVGNSPTLEILKQATKFSSIRGYILKSEISYSLAWAVDFASAGQWVATPGILDLANEHRRMLPENHVILNGEKTFSPLTQHETTVARMALIFSMERRDLADELNITEEWSYGLVSTLYKKLGLDEILHGEVSPEAYLGKHPIMLERFNSICQVVRSSKKAKDMESLAFHLLTAPDLSY